MELLIVAVIAFGAFTLFSMLRKNRNPMNQKCSDEVVQFILSGHFYDSDDNVREIKNIINRYQFDGLEGAHIASLAESKLRSLNVYSESVKRLLKHLYL